MSNDPQTLLSHAKLVEDQVNRAKQEESSDSKVTAESIQKWFEREHKGHSWRRIVEEEKRKPELQRGAI